MRDQFEGGSSLRDEIAARAASKTAQRPDPPLDRTVLSDVDKAELMRWGHGEAAQFPIASCVHLAISQQAALTPHRTAILFDDHEMTYAQLDDRSSRLAKYLTDTGVRQGTVVGLCVERSFELMIAVLGLFKCGATLLPLDLTYPKEWIDYVISDAACEFIIAHKQQRALLPRNVSRVVDLADGSWVQSGATTTVNCDPNATIYVVYTSGSTGRPKGVMVSHRPLINIVCAHRELMPQPQEPRTLQFASINFDVSFHESVFTWLAGGTLILIRSDDRKDPDRLLNTINLHRVDTLFMPPSMLRLMAEQVESNNAPACLRNIVVSGERLEITPAIREMRKRVPALEIHNHYGSNESHVVTTFKLSSTESDWPTFPSAGKPIANALVYVLDENGALLAPGLPGEAYLGGAGIAQGYIGRPDLTAERFVDNPFDRGGPKLYRSGDIVRWREGGCLEFVGRADFQVKIRGFRVELGEIEEVLLKHERVSHAVVTALADPSKDQTLIAYVVLRNRSPLDVHELKAYLRARLPEYMVPAACMRLDSIPLNHNGKIDRSRLPEPNASAFAWAEYEAPQSSAERTIAALWSEILGVSSVGRHDDFFNLGGNSLKAQRMLARLRHLLDVDVSFGTLLSHRTPSRLIPVLRRRPPTEESN